MKTNKNGVKLLAAIMVFAMAFAGAFILIGSEDSDAAITENNVAQIGTGDAAVGYDTLDAAITAVTDGQEIVLLKDCTIENNFSKDVSFTINGTDAKYNITLGNIINITMGAGKTITFKNIEIVNTDTNTDTKSQSNEFQLKGGSIDMIDCAFIGAPGVEYGMTLEANSVGGTFTNVNFNGKVLGTPAGGFRGQVVTITNCQDVRMNYVAKADPIIVKIGTAAAEGVNLIMDKTSATDTTLNFASAEGGTITFDLNGNDYTFKNITERKAANVDGVKLTVQNGTLTNTTFGVYFGDLDDPTTADVYRKSIVKLGNNLILAGKTVVGAGTAAEDYATITGTAKFAENAYIEFYKNAQAVGLTVTGSDSSSVIFNNVISGADKLRISDGSIVIGGEFTVADNGSITVTGGTAKLVADIPANMTVRIEQGATLEVESDVTIENNGTIVNEGTLLNNGNIVNKATIEGDVEGNIPAEVTSDKLILNNYNGSYVFSGTPFKDVVLNGDNVITINDAKGVKNIISLVGGNDGKAYIRSVDGKGTLTIILKGVKVDDMSEISAISAAGALDINGVKITIVITKADGCVNNVYGIKADGKITAFGSTIDIDCVKNYNKSTGISAVEIDLKNSNLTVVAGNAIDTTGLILAESKVDATGYYSTIKATDNISASISSVINAKMIGTGAYAIEATELNTTSGTVVNADSLKIASGENNATIVIGGDIVIGGEYENKATFTSNGDMVISGTLTNSAGTFTNNGIIGVYGKLENAGGEFVNNGEINTYDYKAGTYVDVQEFIGSNGNVKLTFGTPTPLANGTFSVEITVGEGPNDYDLSGILKVDGNTMSIVAKDVGKSVTITVTYNGDEVEKYSITVTSEQFKATNKDVPDYNENALLALKVLIDSLDGNEQIITVTGGKVTNNGTISIEVAQDAFVTGGSLVNAGEIYVNKNITIEGGALSGDAITLGDDVTVTLTGAIDTSFVFAGEYTYTDSNVSVTAAYDNEIAIDGDCVEVTFSTSVIPDDEDDVASITLTKNAAKTDKKVTVTLVKGFFYAADTTEEVDSEDVQYNIFAEGVTVEVLADVVLEANGNIKVRDGVLAAQDGSILNILGETEETWLFGTLTYEISFVKEGYTYYGNIAYALANAAEGMTLTLNGTSTIASDLTVGKGVTLQFAKGATLTFGNDAKDIKVVMLEGASFVFTDESNIVNITIANNEKAVQFSGIIVYDGNTVVLDKVPMVNGNSIGCKATTKTTVSYVKVTLGTITSGTITAEAGKVALKAEFSADTTKTASKLVVAENATVSDLTDSDVISLAAGSSAQIDGTLVFLDDTIISATVSGNGNIVADDNKTVTFDGTIAQNIAVANKGLTDKVVLKDLVANDKDESPATNNTVVITSVKNGTTVYMKVSGTYYSGEISAVGNVTIDDLTVSEKAVFIVPERSTVTVTTDSDANGLVKVAGKINMKIEGDSTTTSYGKLKYDITYADDGYTVYTVIGTAIENASAGDSFTLQKDFPVNGTQEIPSGVTIVVPEDYKIKVTGSLVIGSGITTLGAVGGIVGTIELSDNGYVIDYADASMSGSDMDIVSGTDGKKVVNSRVTVLNQVYATIYALNGNVLLGNDNAGALKDVVPEIDGFRFVKFTDAFKQALGDADKVGDKDVIAEMLADKVQVTFAYVDGIIYYVNGVQQNIVGAPVYVDYNAIITAGKLAGYEGTPLVNGETYVTVTGEMTITGSFSKDVTYNVTFVNGTTVTTQTVVAGALATEPETPVMEGYTFQYWALNGTEYDFTAPVTQDIVLVAVFEAEQPAPETPVYNVIFVNGTDVTVESVKENETVAEPEITAPEGYEFVGWFNGEEKFDFTTEITKDIVLVAVFEQIIPEPEPATPSTGFDVYAKVVDGDIQFRIISQDGYIEDGTFSITLYYTYYDSFVGDYMTDKFVDPVGYTSDESEDVTFTYTIPTDKTYYSASAVFTSGLLKDETGTIFI